MDERQSNNLTSICTQEAPEKLQPDINEIVAFLPQLGTLMTHLDQRASQLRVQEAVHIAEGIILATDTTELSTIVYADAPDVQTLIWKLAQEDYHGGLYLLGTLIELATIRQSGVGGELVNKVYQHLVDTITTPEGDRTS